MKKFEVVNLVLLAALGSICVLQWKKELHASNQIIALDKTQREHEQKIAEQAESLRRTEEDLGGFKRLVGDYQQKIEAQNGLIRTNKAEIFTLTRQNTEFTNQIAEWHQALENYQAVVTNRDANIKVLLEQRESLVKANQDAAEKANGIVSNYNTLAEKYRDAVDRYNKLVAQVQQTQGDNGNRK